jgi:hypothetical protein
MLTLISRRKRKDSILGNGILYGFGVSQHDGSAQFLVETDFGNHLRLTNTEFDELFRPHQPCSYRMWKLEREQILSVTYDTDRIIHDIDVPDYV